MRIAITNKTTDKNIAKTLERSRIEQAGVKINALNSAKAPAIGVVKCCAQEA